MCGSVRIRSRGLCGTGSLGLGEWKSVALSCLPFRAIPEVQELSQAGWGAFFARFDNEKSLLYVSWWKPRASLIG